MRHDLALALHVRLDDFHAACKYDEKRDTRIADVKQNLSRLNLTHLRHGTNTCNLRSGQNRKSLGANIECAGNGRSRHAYLRERIESSNNNDSISILAELSWETSYWLSFSLNDIFKQRTLIGM